MRETFFQICIIFSILLIIFTLSINFVSALGVFGDIDFEQGINIDSGDAGTNLTDISDNVFTKISGYSGGAQSVWVAVMTIGGIISIGTAILMHSAVPIGVYIFSSVFWTSYGRTLNVVNINGIFSTEPMSQFILIITVGLIFIWLGALAGMFSGSG